MIDEKNNDASLKAIGKMVARIGDFGDKLLVALDRRQYSDHHLWNSKLNDRVVFFDTVSDFVCSVIPWVYRDGYCVVINTWFKSWSEQQHECNKNFRFQDWINICVSRGLIRNDHPILEKIGAIEQGTVVIYRTSEYADAKAVFDTFSVYKRYDVLIFDCGTLIESYY